MKIQMMLIVDSYESIAKTGLRFLLTVVLNFTFLQIDHVVCLECAQCHLLKGRLN